MQNTKVLHYGVSEVAYNKTGKTITWAKVHHIDNGHYIKNFSLWTRSELIRFLDQGNLIITIHVDPGSNYWTMGDFIQLVSQNINNAGYQEHFLRTDDSSYSSDYLADLPSVTDAQLLPEPLYDNKFFSPGEIAHLH